MRNVPLQGVPAHATRCHVICPVTDLKFEAPIPVTAHPGQDGSVPQDEPVTRAPTPTAGGLPQSSTGPAEIREPEATPLDHFSLAGSEGQAGPGPGAGAVNAAASEVPKTPARVLRRLIILSVLILVGVITGIWAVQLFPHRPPISYPQPFQIIMNINGPLSLSYVNLSITPNAQSVKVAVQSTSYGPLVTGIENEGSLIIEIPGVVLVSCSYDPQCSKVSNYAGPTETQVTVPLTLGPYRIKGLLAGEEYDLTIKDPRLGFASNGESALAQLPAITSGQRTSSTVLNVAYVASGAYVYDWSIPPYIDSPQGYVAWFQPLSNSIIQPTEITGTNHQAVAQDNRDTFISGILLGVAGAAAIAAAQEGLHVLLDNRDDSRRPKPSRSATSN